MNSLVHVHVQPKEKRRKQIKTWLKFASFKACWYLVCILSSFLLSFFFFHSLFFVGFIPLGRGWNQNKKDSNLKELKKDGFFMAIVLKKLKKIIRDPNEGNEALFRAVQAGDQGLLEETLTSKKFRSLNSQDSVCISSSSLVCSNLMLKVC